MAGIQKESTIVLAKKLLKFVGSNPEGKLWLQYHCHNPDCNVIHKIRGTLFKKYAKQGQRYFFCSAACRSQFISGSLQKTKSVLVAKNANNQNSMAIGRAGEHIAIAYLLAKGYTTFQSEQGLAYDLLVDTPNGMVRVQVKTTNGLRKIARKTYDSSGYVYHNSRKCGYEGKKLYPQNAFDMYCFVALDGPYCGFVAKKDCSDRIMVMYPPSRSDQTQFGSMKKRKSITNFSFKKALKRVLSK